MTVLTLLVAAVAAIGLLAYGSALALRLWNDWLALRRLALRGDAPRTPARLELADLRQRIRRLEAIADGDG